MNPCLTPVRQSYISDAKSYVFVGLPCISPNRRGNGDNTTTTNSLALGNIKFIFDWTNTPSAVEIQMSQLKHSSGKHIPVLLVQSNELPGNMCPVKALWDYLQIRGHETKKEQPLFSLMNNEVVSRKIFKDQLQVCLEYVGHSIKNNKSHSFRIGAATTAWANGFSEEQIQQMG